MPESATVSFVPMAAVSEHSGSIIAAEPRLLREVQKGFTPFQEGRCSFCQDYALYGERQGGYSPKLDKRSWLWLYGAHVIRPSSLVLPSGYLQLFEQRRFALQPRRLSMELVGQQRVPTTSREVSNPTSTAKRQRRLIKILQEAEEIRSLRDEAEANYR